MSKYPNARTDIWSLSIGHSLVIGHWSLVIWVSGYLGIWVFQRGGITN